MTIDEAIQHCEEVADTPCFTDAVSRQAVLDGLASIAKAKAKSDAQKSLMGRIMFFTEQLPSVTPQQRTGRWIQKEEEGEAEPFIIWECSECHCVDEDGKPSYKYCPQCGAKMQEGLDAAD